MGTKKRCCHGSHTQQHGRLPNHSTSDTRRPNVWRVVDILVIARRAQPPRCTDGPFNWSSLSHGNDLSAILCVHGQLFTTIQERSSWDNSLSLTQTGRFYYSLNTRQKMTFFSSFLFSFFFWITADKSDGMECQLMSIITRGIVQLFHRFITKCLLRMWIKHVSLLR